MTPREFRKRQLEKIEQRKIQTHQKIRNEFIVNTLSKNNLVCLQVMFYLASVLEKE
ncbi:RNA replicase, partial [Campylobacter coli]